MEDLWVYLEMDKRKKTLASTTLRVNALLPRLIEYLISNNVIHPRSVLDFGCGDDFYHVKKLQEIFPSIYFDGYDLNYQFPRPGDYDLIFASNVLNVQLRYCQILTFLNDIYNLQSNRAYVFINYPREPRYRPDIDYWEMEDILNFWWYPIRHRYGNCYIWQLCLSKDYQLNMPRRIP